jgi:PiT family inorganic phosphate transporter
MMILAFVSAAALLVAWANGANDSFKGVATLHGSGTLAYRPALLWGIGATFCGSLTAIPIASGLARLFGGAGLVADDVAGDPAFLLSAAAGAALTVLAATACGLPVSTTHALTGGLVGAGIVLAGPAHVRYATLGAAFLLPLLCSPIVSSFLAAAAYLALGRLRRGLGLGQDLCVCVGGVEQMATAIPGSRSVLLSSGLAVSIDSLDRCNRRYAGRVLGIGAQALIDRLDLVTTGAISFARGLNDTPKIAALLVAAQGLGLNGGVVPTALAMALGGLLAARRVARTMSFRITPLSHGQGFTANLVTAALVVLATPLGLPVSTTHVACGSLFGVGTITGEARWRTIAGILSAWVTTLPAAAILAAGSALAAGLLP